MDGAGAGGSGYWRGWLYGGNNNTSHSFPDGLWVALVCRFGPSNHGLKQKPADFLRWKAEDRSQKEKDK